MARRTLADVGRKALEDPAFWRELRADPRKTLQRADYTLEEEEIRALEEAISSNRISFDLDAFLKAAQAMAPDLRWVGRWIGMWPGELPPQEGTPPAQS